MVTLNFDNFILQYEWNKGYVNTVFPDGTWSGGAANKDDLFHGNLLGITPGEHRLLHELAHHLVAIAKGEKACPIVLASAQHKDIPPDANILEWEITAISYMALEKKMRDPQEWGAILRLSKVCDVYKLKNNVMKLWSTFRVMAQMNPN